MKSRFRLTIFFAHLLIGGLSLHGQNANITGSVEGGEGPLPFASIIITGSDLGTISDEDGNYEFRDLQPGTYTLVASHMGYLHSKKEVRIHSNEDKVIDFLLSSSQNLDEVVVSGTMKPTYVSSSPVKVEVVTSKQLNTYLPSASSSIIESISLVNGVQEVVACGVCFTNSISVNGLPGSYTAVLMDGTPMYGSLASVYGLNGIPNMIIDRFEVIKGANSTLYGSEAVAGVINIITKDPEKEPYVSVDLMTSSHEEVFGNLAFAPKIGKSSGFLGINFGTGSYYQDENNDGFGDGVNTDHISVFTKINFSRPSEKLFSLAAKYYREDRRNGVEAFLKDGAHRRLRGSDEIYGESIYTDRLEVFGSYLLPTEADLKIDYSFSNHLQDSYYGTDYYKASQQIAFLNLTWGFVEKKHDVLIGSTLRYDSYDDNTLATEKVIEQEVVNNPNNQFVPGIFAQDLYSFTEKLTALAGLRIDHHQKHGLIYSPRLNLKYKSSDWTTFRLNFGTGFKVVNLFTEDHAFVSGQRELIIAEDLLPESSYNFSLNYNQVYAALGGTGSIDMEGFYTYFKNKILPDYDQPGYIIYENSEGHAQTMGLAINISHRFVLPISLSVGINLMQSTERERLDNGMESVEDILFAPRLSGVLTANYHWRREGITLAYSAQYTGEMTLPEVYDLNEDGRLSERPRSTVSKPFSLHQIQASKEFKKGYGLYFGINNLFNFVQRESPLAGYNDPNYNPGFSPYFDTSYAYAPNHGIEFYVGLKWNLQSSRNQMIAER